jgi:hypothetical protein
MISVRVNRHRSSRCAGILHWWVPMVSVVRPAFWSPGLWRHHIVRRRWGWVLGMIVWLVKILSDLLTPVKGAHTGGIFWRGACAGGWG